MFNALKNKAARISNAAKDNGWSVKKPNISMESVLEWTKNTETPNDATLAEKMKSVAKKVGEEVFIIVFKTYLAMVDPNTNSTHKAILAAGVAYFILPVDMIPDVMVGVGFTDDVAVLALTAKNVGEAIKDEHEEQAKEKWVSYMGESEAIIPEVSLIETNNVDIDESQSYIAEKKVNEENTSHKEKHG